jgi:hypothetical protein
MHSLGIDMGDRQLPPHDSNKDGFFEDLDFLDLHQDILKSNGLDESGLFTDLSSIEVNAYFRNRMEALIMFKGRLRYQWGWKEPRTCLFLEHYNNIVQNPFFLAIYRNPNDVIDSLLRRDLAFFRKYNFSNFSYKRFLSKIITNRYLSKTLLNREDEYFEKWVIYNKNIIDCLKTKSKKCYSILNFDDLLTSSVTLIKTLRNWGFELEDKKLNEIYKPNLVKNQASVLSKDFNKHAIYKDIMIDYSRLASV